MNGVKAYAGMLLGLIFLADSDWVLACDDWAAEVVTLQGEVDRQLYATSTWADLTLGDKLCRGDKIRTARNARTTIRLRNETVVNLDQTTTLTLHRPQADSWIVELLQGIGFFRSRQTQKLQVMTPFVNAVHKGTEFMVAVTAQQSQITVFDGQVAAANPRGEVVAQADQQVLARQGQAPQVQAVQIQPADAVQWSLYYPAILSPAALATLHHPALNALLANGNQVALLAYLEQLPAAQQTGAVLLFRAALLLALGRVDAVEPLLRAMPPRTEASSALALRAMIAVSKNQLAPAATLAQQAIATQPPSAAAWLAQSYVLQAQFKLPEALQASQQATTLDATNALAWARVSELQLANAEFSAALKSAQTAYSLDARLARTQSVLGFAALANTDRELAAKLFQAAIALDSADPLPRLGLGLVYINQGELLQGKHELESAVNLSMTSALMRSYLGKALYELHDTDYAATEFSLAKTLDTHDPTPWFYDAMLKQSSNRPVAALQDLQKAQALNDQRAVYRSRLLLDADKAVRSASLGRIYKELGFDDVARQQATASLTIDPRNFSAHRLLADAYFYRPRQELARASEILQAQLLQPLNFNPIQPQLAYSDISIPKSAGFADTTFNEYTRLFDGDQQRLTATGLYGANDTRADEAVLSGIHNKLAYSLGQMHYQTDGFRPNADLRHNLYNAFVQYQFSPQFSAQAEYRHRETAQGDLEMAGGSALYYSKTYRRQLQLNTYRAGAKLALAPHSDLLFSLIHFDRDERVNVVRSGLPSQFQTQHQGYQFETQYLFNAENFNAVAGGGTYQTNNHLTVDINNAAHKLVYNKTQDYENNQDFAYVYATTHWFKQLAVTTGVVYEHYLDEITKREFTQASPKLGLQWHLNDALTLRLAGFRTVKSPIMVNQSLQPMQIAGFNQLFDDLNGTRATQYGVGLDMRPREDFYLGVEAFKRELGLISSSANPLLLLTAGQREEELYRLYLHWLPTTFISVNSELRFEQFRSSSLRDPTYVETAYVPLNVRFFASSGFFMDVGGQLVHQAQHFDFTLSQFLDFTTNFMLLDAAIGYRLPQRYGMITLEAKNLLDKEFRYRDRNYQTNEMRSSDLIPDRLLFARLSLNF